jgi:hypothetical protein
MQKNIVYTFFFKPYFSLQAILLKMATFFAEMASQLLLLLPFAATTCWHHYPP